MPEPVSEQTIRVEINGETFEQEVEARKLLVHFIRDDLDLTGTHVGCDTGNCGACTVLLDGEPVRSCTTPAGAVGVAKVMTIEGLSPDGLHPVQRQMFPWIARRISSSVGFGVCERR